MTEGQSQHFLRGLPHYAMLVIAFYVVFMCRDITASDRILRELAKSKGWSKKPRSFLCLKRLVNILRYAEIFYK